MGELQLVWGWQPALYLFLGGMGAGAFSVAAVLFLIDDDKNKKVINASMWAAAACLCVGLLLLLSELINPLRGMLLWQSFTNMSSWMMFGAWAIFAAVIVFVALAVLTSGFAERWFEGRGEEESDKGIERKPLRQLLICKILAVLGIILGVCVAAYTGILLMAVPGVPFWNTLLLPCLFTVSAFDTGIALIEVVSLFFKKGLAEKNQKMLEKSVIFLVLLEAAVLVVFLVTMLSGNAGNAGGSESFAATAIASAQLLVSGELCPFFWALFVGCGLAVPLVAAILCLRKGKGHSRTVMAVGAFGALVGGCALRFLVLLAGTHASFVADAVLSLM